MFVSSVRLKDWEDWYSPTVEATLGIKAKSNLRMVVKSVWGTKPKPRWGRRTRSWRKCRCFSNHKTPIAKRSCRQHLFWQEQALCWFPVHLRCSESVCSSSCLDCDTQQTVLFRIIISHTSLLEKPFSNNKFSFSRYQLLSFRLLQRQKDCLKRRLWGDAKKATSKKDSQSGIPDKDQNVFLQMFKANLGQNGPRQKYRKKQTF